MSDGVEKAAGVIPEVYYDLIARVLPGFMFYICVGYAWCGTLNKPETLLDSVIGVAACYVLGFVLDVLGDMVVDSLFRIIGKFKIIGRDNAKKKVTEYLTDLTWSQDGTKPQDGGIFVKLCAEIVLLRSLMLTSLIFFVFSVLTHTIKTLPQYLSGGTPYIFFLLALLILMFRHFNNYVLDRLSRSPFLKKKSPCLNSSNECVAELTEKAIANSHKLKTLEERITLIEQLLELAEDRIEYTRKKKWTNYISANPINILQNIFGGGDVQRDNIAIAQRLALRDHAVPGFA